QRGTSVGAERYAVDVVAVFDKLPKRLARGIPPPGKAAATGQQRLAVGAEGHGQDSTRTLERFCNRLGGGRVPSLSGAVGAADQNGLAVGAEGRGVDQALRREGSTKRPWRFPQANEVPADRQHRPTVGAESHSVDPVLMRERTAQGLAG